MTGFVIGADRGQVYKFLGIFLGLNNVCNVATRANEKKKKKKLTMAVGVNFFYSSDTMFSGCVFRVY